MKTQKQMLLLAGVALALSLGTGKVAAQGRGNFDPEQARQRMMERYREALEVKSDDEWKLIGDRIGKVSDARREVGGGMGGFGFGRPNRGAGGAGGNADNNNDQAGRRGGNRGGPGGPGGEPSAEAQALQKAIEAKAPADEIKAKLAKVREVRKEKEAKLEKAQDELRQVLSVRQEGTAVLMGLLK